MTTPSKYTSKTLDKLASDYEGFRPEYRFASAELVMARLRDKNPIYKGKTLPEMHVMFKAALKRLNLTAAIRMYQSDRIQHAGAEKQRKEESKTARRDERRSRRDTLDDLTERGSVDPNAAVDYVGLPSRFDED